MVKNKKNRLIIMLIALIILFFVVTAIVTFISIDPSAYKRYKMFGSVDDFARIIETHGFEEMPVGEDKFIADISFVNMAKHKVKAAKKTYVIFAYEFETSDGSREYYKKVTGKKIEGNSSYSGSGNVYFKNRLIIFQYNKVYRIEGQNIWDFQKFVEILSSELPEQFQLWL